jgi:hypothetical protein
MHTRRADRADVHDASELVAASGGVDDLDDQRLCKPMLEVPRDDGRPRTREHKVDRAIAREVVGGHRAEPDIVDQRQWSAFEWLSVFNARTAASGRRPRRRLAVVAAEVGDVDAEDLRVQILRHTSRRLNFAPSNYSAGS